jgi:hypothetical protein
VATTSYCNACVALAARSPCHQRLIRALAELCTNLVAVQTVYVVFHTKAALLARAIDFAVMGRRRRDHRRSSLDIARCAKHRGSTRRSVTW